MHFMAQFLRNPAHIGAVAPSSRALAGKMATGLGSAARVLELGGGTGTLTRGLVAAGVAEAHLTVLEMNPHFIRTLRARFPGAAVIDHSAFEIDTLPDTVAALDAVISGLPLVNMSAAEHRAILAGAFARLKPHGFLRQFTYRPRCPVSDAVLSDHGLVAHYEGLVLRNLPPAFVYRIARAAPATPAAVKRHGP